MKLKSQLAPKNLDFSNMGSFVVSDKYATILSIISYPKYVQTGFLSDITNMSGIKVVIKHIPIAFSVLSKMLNKEIADIDSRLSKENDRTIAERLSQDRDSLEYFIQNLAASQTKIFDFQMHLMITADTKEDLENKIVSVKNFLESQDMRATTLRFEQEKVLKSILPIFPKQTIEERVGTPIPSVTIAAMYPFIFDSIKDPGLSTLLGVDFSGGVILFNQFLYQIKKEHNRNNANLIILGTSGSGKSTTAKLLLRGHIRNGHQIVAIDPEGELADMTNLYEGDFIDLGKGGEYGMINPLEIILDADDEEMTQGLGYTVLTKTLQSTKAFLKYYSPDITEDVLALFSEILQETYRRYGIDFNSDFTKFKSEDYPTFRDVYATINGRMMAMQERTQEREIMEKLEIKIRPLTNELKYYFDGHTTIKLHSDFIVFNIKELMNADANIRNALFFNVLKYAWGLCLDKRKNTAFYVDEAHVLLGGNNALGADFLAQIQRRARKYNSGTIISTQQPTDFTNANIITQGKAIFDNASYYVIMGLKKQAVDDLSILIDLNDNEKDSIKRYGQGEALFICGSRRMRISIIITPSELESFGERGGA